MLVANQARAFAVAGLGCSFFALPGTLRFAGSTGLYSGCSCFASAPSFIDQSCAWVAFLVQRLCVACQVEDPGFVEHFGGNRLLPGSETAAHCYAGHQFGHFSGQLGDGAAIYLGEVASFQWTVPGSFNSRPICVPPCRADSLLICIVLVCLCFPVQTHQVACPS